MAFLQEFSKIAFFKDTPKTRYLFGPPLNSAELKNPGVGVSTTNPYYNRLLQLTGFQNGWRQAYPDLSTTLAPGSPSNSDPWKDARLHILQAIGNEENNTEGYNLPPESSGTGIIYGNTLYLGSTTSVEYDSVDSDGDEVVVSGTFPAVGNGKKVKLTAIDGISGLSIDTTYYTYAATSANSFKLASSASNASGGVPLEIGVGTSSPGVAYITEPGFSYQAPTSFATPSPQLVVGDYIFWGDDPNGLKIGGKITEVYTSGAEYNAGARYKFENPTEVAFPTYSTGPYSGDPIPQQIYYYRKSWNGKGISNDIGAGFYVLIGVEQDVAQKYTYYPYLGADDSNTFDTNGNAIQTSENKIVDCSTVEKYAFTDLIRIRRISNRFKSDETDTGVQEEIIPCTIHRTNNFYYDSAINISNGQLTSLFGNIPNNDIFPWWVAYYVNPWGGNSNKLDKNSTYVLEVNERLPAAYLPNKSDIYNYALNGGI